jgi:hypothetical protein
MRKRCYLAALMRQSPDWVRASMAEPTSYMTRTHVLLHSVALQRMRALTPNALYPAPATPEDNPQP